MSYTEKSKTESHWRESKDVKEVGYGEFTLPALMCSGDTAEGYVAHCYVTERCLCMFLSDTLSRGINHVP